MRHIAFFCLTFLSFCCITQATIIPELIRPERGEYQLTVNYTDTYNLGNEMRVIRLWAGLWTTNWVWQDLGNAQTEGEIEAGHKIKSIPNTVHTYEAKSSGQLPIRSIIFGHSRRWRYWSIKRLCWIYDATEERKEYKIDTAQPYYIRTIWQPFGSLYGGSVDISLLPKRIKLYYYSNPSNFSAELYGGHLPSDDTIRLSATQNFMPSTYKWRYKDPNTDQWHDFPSNLHYTDGRATVTFTGRQLIPDFDAVAGKKIKVSINTPSVERQDTIILDAAHSAPHIKSYSVHPPKCADSDAASIVLRFDRKLKFGEELSIFVNSVLSEKSKLREGSDSCVVEVIAGQQYRITLGGSRSCLNHFILTEVVALSKDEKRIKGMPPKNTFQNSERLVELPDTSYLRGAMKMVLPPKFLKPCNKEKLYASGKRHLLTTGIIPKASQIESKRRKLIDVACVGGKDGRLEYEITGGTGRYNVTLKNQGYKDIKTTGRNAIFTGLKAGTYTLSIEDSNECRINDRNETIQQPDTLAVKLKTITPPKGNTTSDGKITFEVNGGTTPYSFYLWEQATGIRNRIDCKKNANALYEYEGLKDGKYNLTVMDKRYSPTKAAEDSNGCLVQLLGIAVTAPDPLVVSLEETQSLNCFGDKTGSITAHAKGGVKQGGVYQYTWYKITGEGKSQELPYQNDSVMRALDSGTYYVKVTDQNEIYTISTPLKLQSPRKLTVALTVEQRPTCQRANGVLSAVITGGVAPYQYAWEDASEKSLLRQGLAPNTYSLSVEDRNGCRTYADTVLTTAAPLKLEVDITEAKCFGNADGEIVLAPTGGTAPYSFQWHDGATAPIRQNLNAGVYSVELKDAEGCTLSRDLEIKQPDKLNVSLGDNFTLCSGQTRTIKAVTNEKDLQYQWHFNTQEITEQTPQLKVGSAGRYTCSVVNPNGCKAEATINVQVSSVELTLAIAMSSVVSINIPIHAVNISRMVAERIEWILPEGAQQISTSDYEAVFSMPATGKYTLTAIGYKNGCSTSYEHALEVVEHDLIKHDDKTAPLVKQFEILPNPNNGRFRAIVGLSRPENFKLTLYSPKPSVIDIRESRMTQEGDFEYNLSNHPEGVYLLELRVGTQKAVQKIIKNR